jgi:hypothetical protein
MAFFEKNLVLAQHLLRELKGIAVVTDEQTRDNAHTGVFDPRQHQQDRW